MKKTNKLVLSVIAVCVGFSGYALAAKGGYPGPPYKQTKGDKEKGYEKEKGYKKDYNKDKHKYFKTYEDWYEYHYGKYEPYEAGTEKRLALNLVGKGPMYNSYVPDIDGDKQPDPAFCFDVDLKTIADSQLIGTATDCLSMIEPGENGGVKLVGTTFFNLPDGQIVTRGITTVQPVNTETVTPEGYDITHITGASSNNNGVIKATGAYEWYRGPVRLSGMVNLSEFFENEGDPIFFDCLFTIDLMKINTSQPYWYRWYDKYFGRDYYKEYYGQSSYEGSGEDSSGGYYDDSGEEPSDDYYGDSGKEPSDDYYGDSGEEPSDDYYDDSGKESSDDYDDDSGKEPSDGYYDDYGKESSDDYYGDSGEEPSDDYYDDTGKSKSEGY